MSPDPQLLRKWLVLSLSRSKIIQGLLPSLAKLPGGDLLMRPAYSVFCGGSTFAEAQVVAKNLASRGIGTIYDFVAEGQGQGDQVKQELLKMIAGSDENSAVAIKLSALIPYDELKRPAKPEHREILRPLLKAAKHVPLLIDAEQTEIQGTIRELALWAAGEDGLVGNTYQMYLKGALDTLQADMQTSKPLIVKLVRGAYLSTEPKDRLVESEAACHEQYNEAIRLLATRMLSNPGLRAIIATHNEESVRQACDLIRLNPTLRSRMQFAQLLGMGDALTDQLVKQGFRVSKYLPFGPAKEALPYLIRRMEENAAVAKRLDAELERTKRALFK